VTVWPSYGEGVNRKPEISTGHCHPLAVRLDDGLGGNTRNDVMPERIQLKRTKGWRMPPNTVKVSRPGKWGNPYSVAEYGRDLAVRNYRNRIEGMRQIGALDLSELRGKNLACWCKPGALCHADVLIELANP
jgi:hypothetical protein